MLRLEEVISDLEEEAKLDFLRKLLVLETLPWDVQEVFPVALGYISNAQLRDTLLTFMASHLSDDQDAGTSFILKVIEVDYDLAVQVITARLLSVDNKTILQNVPPSGDKYQHAFLLSEDSRRAALLLELNGEQDICWCLSQCTPEDALRHIHFAMSQCKKDKIGVFTRAYAKYIQTHTEEVDLDKELALLDGRGLDYIAPEIVSSVSQLESGDGQLVYAKALISLGKHSVLELQCKEGSIIEPLRLAEALGSADLADLTPLIILCDRYGLVDWLVEHLVRLEKLEYLKAYITAVNPAARTPSIEMLLRVGKDPSKILMECKIGGDTAACIEICEALFRSRKFSTLVTWLNANKDQLSVPIVATIYAQAMVLGGDYSAADILEISGTDFSQIAKTSESMKDFDLAAQCYARAGLWDKCLGVFFDCADIQTLLKILSRETSDPLWKLLDGRHGESTTKLRDLTVHIRALSPTELKTLASHASSSRIGSLFADPVLLVWSESTAKVDIVESVLNLVYEHKREKLRDFIDNSDAGIFDQVFGFLVSKNLLKEAIDFGMRHGREDRVLGVLLANSLDLKRAERLCEDVDSTELWAMLGSHILSSGAMSHPSLLNILTRGQISDCWDRIVSDSRILQLEDSGHYLRFLWECGIHDKLVASTLGQSLIKSNDKQVLSSIITGCNDLDAVSILRLNLSVVAGARNDLLQGKLVRSITPSILQDSLARVDHSRFMCCR